MTGVATDRRNLVERGLEGLSLDAADHANTLLAGAKAALVRRDFRLAWLLADRLLRLIGDREAIPLLLRSAALAALGQPAEARADIEAAARIDPHHLLVAQILLRDPDGAKRQQGGRVLLAAGPDNPLFTDAMAAMAREQQAVVLARKVGDGVSISVWWRGAAPPALAITDGTTRTPMILPQAGSAAPKTGFDHRVEAHLDWPDAALAIAIEGPGDVLIEPSLLYRTGVTQTADPAPKVSENQPSLKNPPSRLLVIVPIYDDALATRACLDSLGPALPDDRPCRIVIVDDAGPSPDIRVLIAEIERDGRFDLVKNALNLGFAASVNRALAMRLADEDVVILNADTILPPGAIGHLIATAEQDDRIGTATPLSNNGEDTSVPRRFLPNPLLSAERIAALDRLAWQANGTSAIDMPNGVGFCLFVKAAVVEAVGPLPLDYGRGYYEDVAFCLKAAAAGFRNVCATGVYIGHAGARSFRGEKQGLIRRNLARLSQAFPAYRDAAKAFETSDPLRPALAAIEMLDASEATGLRLVFVPSDCPRDMARVWASHLPTDASRSLLVQLGRDAEDTFSIRAADGDFPQNLRLTNREWHDFIADAARRQTISEVLLVDPAAEAGEDLAVLLGMDVPIKIILASVLMARRSPPHWIAEKMDVHVATPALAAIARIAGWPEPKSTIDPSFEAKNALPRSGRVLAIRTLHFDKEARACLAALRSGIRKRGLDLGLALLGREDGDLALMTASRLWVSGEIKSEDIGRWVDFAAASALVLLDRGYGLASPDCAAAASAGIPFACFDPRLEGSSGWLRLDPLADADAIADRIIRWTTTFAG